MIRNLVCRVRWLDFIAEQITSDFSNDHVLSLRIGGFI